MRILVLFLILSYSLRSYSDTLSETFSNTQNFSSGTLVLNLTEGYLHPPLFISQWQQPPAAAADTNIQIGDGHHGTFTSTDDYARFSTNGDLSGNIIRINTDTYTELEFTQFNLLAGWSIIPTGSKPLIIRVQGNATVAGSIVCNGQNGEAANADPTITSLGGSGACGGGNGGNGGTSSVKPDSGYMGDAPVGYISAGTKADSLASTSGGGGGGGFAQPAFAAEDGFGPSKGLKGTSYMDGGFTVLGGGSGGAGGSANTKSGGGGGGGGGTIIIHAFGDILISGSISANGGAGGSSSAGASGSGGGGAGGSIWLISGKSLTIDGTVTADGGLGGDSLNIGNHGDNGDGGNGASGRVWTTDSIGGFGGTGTVSPASSGLTSDGVTRFQTGVFTRASIVQDLLNYHIQFGALTPLLINSGSGSYSATVEGSRRGFDLETTGPVDSANLSAINNSRYIKITVSLNNTNDTTPIILDSLSLDYAMGSPNEFKYTSSSGCGSIKPTSDSHTNTFLNILILFLPVLVFVGLRKSNQMKIHSQNRSLPT
ncbi:MAG: hypothetical protein BroJett040_05980 [Oligoflexia bacterium]|nr:MAG: hypothetical protein BroJett040_05980 [Oligoflexia bacterium]